MSIVCCKPDLPLGNVRWVKSGGDTRAGWTWPSSGKNVSGEEGCQSWGLYLIQQENAPVIIIHFFWFPTLQTVPWTMMAAAGNWISPRNCATSEWDTYSWPTPTGIRMGLFMPHDERQLMHIALPEYENIKLFYINRPFLSMISS